MADHPSSRPRPRDSHDLTPRDVTRDSLVANMLLSLDQFSLGQTTPAAPSSNNMMAAAYDDFSARLWANDAARPRRRSRAHKSSHGSSSSDVVFDPVSTPIPHSNTTPSDFHTQLLRLGVVHDPSHRSRPGTSPRASAHARPARHRNGSSGSASIDAAYSAITAPNRHGRPVRRSASFDHGLSAQALRRLKQSSPPRADFAHRHQDGADDYDDYDDYDDDDDDQDDDEEDEYSAAPMPTIPSGPRREPSVGLRLPPPPPDPAEPRCSGRKRSSSRSTKSSTARSKPSTGHRTASATPTSPAMAQPEADSAPAPSVGYRKPKEKEKEKEAEASAPAPAQPKERPGFFRRVFGGGSSRTNLAAVANGGSHDPHNSSLSPTSPDRNRPGSNNKTHQQPHATQPKACPALSSRDLSNSSLTQQPPLQKKTSNFFRRRKKSTVDETPALSTIGSPPPLPSLDTVLPATAAAAATEASASAQKSPTSSLRIVMNPYLNGGAAGLGLSNMQSSPLADITNATGDRPAHSTGREGYKRGFSPEYEPSPSARIRAVHSEDGSARVHEADGTPVRTRAQRSRQTSETGDSSFLDLDGGSDNEIGSPERYGDKGSVKGKKKLKHAKKKRCKDADTELAEAGQGEQDPDATIRGGKKLALAASEQGDREPSRPCLAPPPVRATSPRSLGSTETGYRTAPSAPPSVLVEGTPDESGARALSTLESIQAGEPLDEPDFVVGEPTEDDRQKAQKIYDGGQGFIQKEKAASWMGEEGPVRQRTLQAYMELYDFRDKSILGALRSVCERLVLRAETQQVDRILVAFSKRWCWCNPRHGFKATDVIHTICYSIMLLNTDLHLADIEQKMTRSQFVKNTMTTIMQAVAESVPTAFSRPSILPEKNSSILGGDHGRASPDLERVLRRSSFLPRSDTQGSFVEDCGPLIKAPFHGSMKAWEEQVELVLKNIYASIRDQRLPLFGAEPDKHLGASQNSLSVMGMLKRSPSVLSKSPSETQLSSRGRVTDSSRTSASRWTSKSRSRPGFGRTGFSSSRTSFDDGHSVWSPAMSSATWSRYSLGRTQGSASQDSFAPTRPRGDYQQSIGFANALSQAIVREDEAVGNENAPSILSSEAPTAQLLEDETLELAGPPWVKEGMVVHKHHLDGVGRKARDRNWAEVFAVVQKGQLSLFSFTANKSTARQKVRARNAPSGPVGGGNWQDSAVSLGTFNLRLTLASALPPPGYSRTRPHVWALSLPTGAVHLFQVGTPEIIREFVHTANYWSARLSSHPLVGGISNVEYGWSESIVNNALVAAVHESAEAAAGGSIKASRPGSSAAHARKSSVASNSFRAASFDQVAGSFAQGSGRGNKLPGDRIHIAEWAPPTQSMRPSKAVEAAQLETLVAYVKSIEADLQAHNQLRSPMLLAFTPRGHNAGKAMANWERKSAYLLREIVKFRTYVDCLQQAEARKREVYAERSLAHKAARGELSDGDMEVSDGEEADETLRPA